MIGAGGMGMGGIIVAGGGGIEGARRGDGPGAGGGCRVFCEWERAPGGDVDPERTFIRDRSRHSQGVARPDPVSVQL